MKHYKVGMKAVKTAFENGATQFVLQNPDSGEVRIVSVAKNKSKTANSQSWKMTCQKLDRAVVSLTKDSTTFGAKVTYEPITNRVADVNGNFTQVPPEDFAMVM